MSTVDPYPHTRVREFGDGWCQVTRPDGTPLSATMPHLDLAYAYQAGVEEGVRMAEAKL